MKAFATLTRGIIVAAMASLVGSAPALAATFVYVSNAEDGDIGVYVIYAHAPWGRQMRREAPLAPNLP